MRKSDAVDFSFQTYQNKNVMMLCGDGSFPPSPEDEDSVPRGSM
jgi:hypothetical protein